MSSGVLIVTGTKCRFCPRLIPDSIKGEFGNEAAGYICPDCAINETLHIEKFCAELSALQDRQVEIEDLGSPADCAMCGSPGAQQMRMVNIDGRMGFVCLTRPDPQAPTCEEKWIALNREKLGPKYQYARKLR